MAHYTLQSGVSSKTITSRCLICLTVTYHSEIIYLSDETVCCNSCKEQYISALWDLWSRAQQWGASRGLTNFDAFNQYMAHVGV
jgi:hypothetical protein